MSDSNTQNENIAGRKIFFLYPTAAVTNHLITELAQQEYEAYISKNHTKLFKSFKEFPDSIVYLNVDEGMSIDDWEKWTKALQASFPDVSVGVITSNTSEELQERLQKEIKISCGYFVLKLEMNKTIALLIATLEKLGIKGRRKYVRATTENETTATINMPANGDFVKGTILDISVVGFSCLLDTDPGLKKNSLNTNIQIRLKTMLIKAEAITFGSRKQGDDNNVYVLLFTHRLDPEAKVKIRKYIQQNLQSKMDSKIN